MPKYTLPAEKKGKKGNVPTVPSDSMEWQRRVTLPVNTAILDAVDTDDKVTVTIEGTVTREVSESGNFKEHSLTINLSSVELYPKEGGKANKEFEKGYKRGKAAM